MSRQLSQARLDISVARRFIAAGGGLEPPFIRPQAAEVAVPVAQQLYGSTFEFACSFLTTAGTNPRTTVNTRAMRLGRQSKPDPFRHCDFMREVLGRWRWPDLRQGERATPGAVNDTLV